MLEMLKKQFEEKQAKHNELVSKYNSKIESKQKVESEMLEIEKEIIHNQGAMKMLDDLAAKIMSEQQPAEVITSDTEAEIVTEA